MLSELGQQHRQQWGESLTKQSNNGVDGSLGLIPLTLDSCNTCIVHFPPLTNSKFFIGLKKVVSVIGSSMVYWAARSTSTRPGGKDLTLQTKNITIQWFGIRGMRWQDFDSTFEKKLKYTPTKLLGIALRFKWLRYLVGPQLFQSIKCLFLRCKLLPPNMSIVSSDMLHRLYWHKAKSAARVDSMHKEVNRKVKQFLKSEGGGVIIRHPNISFAHKDLFRYDGTHLNQLSNSVFLYSLQSGL